jgi:chromosome segregation ATPase
MSLFQPERRKQIAGALEVVSRRGLDAREIIDRVVPVHSKAAVQTRELKAERELLEATARAERAEAELQEATAGAERAEAELQEATAGAERAEAELREAIKHIGEVEDVARDFARVIRAAMPNASKRTVKPLVGALDRHPGWGDE